MTTRTVLKGESGALQPPSRQVEGQLVHHLSGRDTVTHSARLIDPVSWEIALTIGKVRYLLAAEAEEVSFTTAPQCAPRGNVLANKDRGVRIEIVAEFRNSGTRVPNT